MVFYIIEDEIHLLILFQRGKFHWRNMVGFAASCLLLGFWKWCVWLQLVLDLWCAWAPVHGGYLWTEKWSSPLYCNICIAFLRTNPGWLFAPMVKCGFLLLHYTFSRWLLARHGAVVSSPLKALTSPARSRFSMNRREEVDGTHVSVNVCSKTRLQWAD